MKKIIAIILIVTTMSGCASTYFKARYEMHGEYRVDSPHVIALNENPRLFIESAPEGVFLQDNSIVVDTNKYQILGRIDVVRNFDSWDIGFIEFNENWRRYYCPGVVALTYATLLIFAWTPAPWPCFYESSTSISRIEERKRNMVKVMIQKARDIGATHVVYAKYTHSKSTAGTAIIMPVGNMAMAVGSSEPIEFPYTGLTGIALRSK